MNELNLSADEYEFTITHSATYSHGSDRGREPYLIDPPVGGGWFLASTTGSGSHGVSFVWARKKSGPAYR